MDFLNSLKLQFNDRVSLREQRPGINKLIAPLFHEDGDMLDIFLEQKNDNVKISDYGMTLMRLSYYYEIDSPTKEKIYNRILAENNIKDNEGNLYIDTKLESLYPAIMQFAQTIAKISNLKFLKNETIKSLFYETIDNIINEKLNLYNPIPKVCPIDNSNDYQSDYMFDIKPYPIYLFAVNNNAKAREAALCFREYQTVGIKYKGFVVHENLDNLSAKDRNRITSASDKQFTSSKDFEENAESVFKREVA